MNLILRISFIVAILSLQIGFFATNFFINAFVFNIILLAFFDLYSHPKKSYSILFAIVFYLIYSALLHLPLAILSFSICISLIYIEKRKITDTVNESFPDLITFGTIFYIIYLFLSYLLNTINIMEFFSKALSFVVISIGFSFILPRLIAK